MRYVVWLAFALSACSGSTHGSAIERGTDNSGEASEPAQPTHTARNKGDIEVMTSAACNTPPRERVDLAEISQRTYCVSLAAQVALCESPHEEITCERFSWLHKRREQLRDECMSQDIDEAKLSFMIDSVGTCAYGEDYDKGIYLNFPCRHRYKCWQSIGMRWTPYQPEQGQHGATSVSDSAAP